MSVSPYVRTSFFSLLSLLPLRKWAAYLSPILPTPLSWNLYYMFQLCTSFIIEIESHSKTQTVICECGDMRRPISHPLLLTIESNLLKFSQNLNCMFSSWPATLYFVHYQYGGQSVHAINWGNENNRLVSNITHSYYSF